MEIDINLSQFHDIFFEESFEGIETMETELLNLSPGTADSEIINTIFRAAHSIKGSASTFGFSEISDFTHNMETVLDKIRNQELVITQQLIAVLLSAVDSLNNMLIGHRDAKPYDPTLVESVSIQLEQLSSCTETEAPPLIQQGHQRETQGGSTDGNTDQRWRIGFFPHEKLFYTGNDPLRLIRELSTLGEFAIKTEVDHLPDFDDLDVHNCYLGWRIQIQGQITRTQIEEVFAWVEGDCKLEITREIERRSSEDRRKGPERSGRRKTDTEHRSIRVNTDKIDNLLNLVGELVITQSILHRALNEQGMDTSDKLLECLEQLERNTRDLQEQTMSIRMLPVDNAFQRIPRIVHDLSIAQGKQVTLEFSGESTELDKTVLEKIKDPLVHLVRNALDHGIETPETRAANGKPEQGMIRINASHEGGYVVLRISDDGNGINPDKLLATAVENNLVAEGEDLSQTQIQNLIFLPGFSTSHEINDISGRGVGMDVVKRNISDLGGTVDVWSEQGTGSTFTIRLPLTLAILDGQIVRIGRQIFIMPLHSIKETVIFNDDDVNTVTGKIEMYRYRDEYIPLIRLTELFNIEPETSADRHKLLVVFEVGDKHIGILVDDVIGQQQVVIKSLENNYKSVPGLAGATVLGDGSVALIIDVLGLAAQHRDTGSRANTG
jgi:two-component system chemotaxis sensor kinase CheA